MLITKCTKVYNLIYLYNWNHFITIFTYYLWLQLFYPVSVCRKFKFFRSTLFINGILHYTKKIFNLILCATCFLILVLLTITVITYSSVSANQIKMDIYVIHKLSSCFYRTRLAGNLLSVCQLSCNFWARSPW